MRLDFDVNRIADVDFVVECSCFGKDAPLTRFLGFCLGCVWM